MFLAFFNPNIVSLSNGKFCFLLLKHYFVAILPTLLDGMQLTACRRAIIHRHLYMFIHYLDRTSKFWFSKCWSHEKDMRSGNQILGKIFSGKSCGD